MSAHVGSLTSCKSAVNILTFDLLSGWIAEQGAKRRLGGQQKQAPDVAAAPHNQTSLLVRREKALFHAFPEDVCERFSPILVRGVVGVEDRGVGDGDIAAGERRQLPALRARGIPGLSKPSPMNTQEQRDEVCSMSLHSSSNSFINSMSSEVRLRR